MRKLPDPIKDKKTKMKRYASRVEKRRGVSIFLVFTKVRRRILVNHLVLKNSRFSI